MVLNGLPPENWISPGVDESRFEDKGALVRPYHIRVDRIHAILSFCRVLNKHIVKNHRREDL